MNGELFSLLYIISGHRKMRVGLNPWYKAHETNYMSC